MTWDDLLIRGWEVGIREEDLLRMSFAQIHRALAGARGREKAREVLTREVAYLIYATHARNPQQKEAWWPIGVQKSGPAELQEDWVRYKRKKRNKISQLWQIKK